MSISLGGGDDVKTAKIYSYSIIYISSEEFKKDIPYVVAILEDESGTRFPAKVIGYNEGRKVAIGDKVDFVSNDDKFHFVYTF